VASAALSGVCVLIFLTVGFQMPFDRLVRAVDEWCSERGRNDVFGQIADPGPGGYRPQHFEWLSFLEPDQIRTRFEEADLVVAHAGMGSIISALTMAKPILVMPRRAAFSETRNDHQVATAEHLGMRPGIQVALTEAEVGPELDRLIEWAKQFDVIQPALFAEDLLIDTLRSYIVDGEGVGASGDDGLGT
jgi:UDP-N-acetylglucosamine transferase subunit ALG13